MNDTVYCEHVTKETIHLSGDGLVFWLSKNRSLFLCQKCKDAIFGQIMKRIMEKQLITHSFTSKDIFGS